MRNLLVLRHAKSSWDNPDLSDHDRPLNPRGLRDGPRMARLIESKDLLPQLIISSTAARAKRTALMIAQCASFYGALEFDSELYMAMPNTYLNSIRMRAATLDPIMVIGHNPGIEELISDATHQPCRMPTAALAWLAFDVDDWNEIEFDGTATLNDVWRPKEL